jgi:6-phosphofructokinase 1
VRDILPLGGTILGAGRFTPAGHDDARLDEIRAAVTTLELDGLIVIGDSGGLAVGHAVAKRGVPVVGIPGTMDNDVGGTDYCIGFDSAVSTVAEAVDKLQTTASAHHRVMVVEAMGRDTGWVALAGAICGSAHMVVVPEVAVGVTDIVQRLRARHDAGHHFTILVVAEGAVIEGLPGQAPLPAGPAATRVMRPSVGELIGVEIEAHTGYETRVTVLGHLQRGGSPTVHDRLMATRFGVAAVEAALEGQWDRMVALKGNRVLPVPLSEAGRRRPADLSLYDLATLF